MSADIRKVCSKRKRTLQRRGETVRWSKTLHSYIWEPEHLTKVDKYGNPLNGDSLPFCCFPDCGCDGARLCMAESGANSAACSINIERGAARATFAKATGSGHA